MTKLLSILMLSIILFGCSNNQPKKTNKKRVTKLVLIDELIDKGTQEISCFYYKSRLFNGTAFDVYPNSKLSQKYTIKNGLIDGLYKTYYENGKLKGESSYSNGLLNGLVKNWNEDGQLEAYNYENGQLVRIQTEIITEPIEGEIIEQKIERTEKIVTQSSVETPVTKREKKKTIIKKEEPEEEVIEEKKPEVSKKALYPGKKKNPVAFESRNADLGDSEGGGGNGIDNELGNRNPIFLPDPIYDSEAEGVVVVHIIVDQFGDVLSVSPGEKGSTTQNKQLLGRAKEAAFKTKYPPKADAPNQHGKLIYNFQKN